MATPQDLPISRRGMIQAIGACGAATLGVKLTGAAEENTPPRPSEQRHPTGAGLGDEPGRTSPASWP